MDRNEVRGNLIGTQKDGLKHLGNGQEGVGVFEDIPGTASGNSILSNTVFSNGSLGIDLGSNDPTANDPGDAGAGPNGLQNRPLLGSTKTVSGRTIKGTLDSRAGATYTVLLLSNPSGTERARSSSARRRA